MQIHRRIRFSDVPLSNVPLYTPARYTILAEIITKEFLGTISFVKIFVIITKIIPPEDFLCNAAATGGSLFARKQAKDFAL